MKERRIETHQQLAKAVTDISHLADHLPFVLTITSGKRIRSTAANARYWAGLNEYLNQINSAISQVEGPGYTNLEARRVIANELPPEHAAILYATKAEVIHDVMKLICGVPTSTKLGSKDFMQFETIMEATMVEIIGEINAVARQA